MSINHQFVGNSQSKKLIIFLHEGLGSLAQWKHFPEKLCRLTNSYGFVYDRSGYGKSPGDLTTRNTHYLHESANELEEIMKQYISNDYNVYLYGHSDGGSIALIYASQNASKISGLIVEAAHVFVEDETVQGVQHARENFKQNKFIGLQKYHGARYEEVFWAWNNIWLNPAFRSWNIVSLLKHITCPQLIIQGKNDQYATLKQVEAIATKSRGKSTIFIPENSGHAPHKEEEEAVLDVTKNFVHGN